MTHVSWVKYKQSNKFLWYCEKIFIFCYITGLWFVFVHFRISSNVMILKYWSEQFIIFQKLLFRFDLCFLQIKLDILGTHSQSYHQNIQSCVQRYFILARAKLTPHRLKRVKIGYTNVIHTKLPYMMTQKYVN